MSDNKNIMIFLNGRENKSFHCNCGCNVFHHPEDSPKKFECNSCKARYIGEHDTEGGKKP